MQRPHRARPVSPNGSERRRVAAWLAAGTLLAVAGACSSGGDAGSTVPTPASTATAPASTSPTTAAPAPTTIAPAAPTTPTPSTTAPPSSAPPATAPPSTGSPAANPFVGDAVEIAAPYFEQPFMMQRASDADGLTAYDGVSDDGTISMRCVAITRDGASTWSEWCGEPDTAAAFVVLDGIDPWLVDVGAEPGAIRLTRQPSDWAVVSGGCTEPIVSIATAAELGPSTATGIWCADTEALLTFSPVFLQPGRPDGGTALLSNGAEGWNLVNTGTSLDCGGYDDGIDRCALFDTTGELFGKFPVPPSSVLTAVEAVGVRDETDEIRAAAGDAGDVSAAVDQIVAALTPAEAEATPIVAFTPDAGWGLDALVVEVPALDDSIRSTMHIAWLREAAEGGPAEVAGAFAWELCARGLADATTCV